MVPVELLEGFCRGFPWNVPLIISCLIIALIDHINSFALMALMALILFMFSIALAYYS